MTQDQDSPMNPTDHQDFTGCRRACGGQGEHTRIFGECEIAPWPEPAVSMSKTFVDIDGHKSIGFDRYTLQELADLIEPALREVNVRFGPNSLELLRRGYSVRPSGGEAAELARTAAHAILHRNDKQDALGPADGHQKMRLLAKLREGLTAIPEGEAGCAHCGSTGHVWDACETYALLVTAEQSEPECQWIPSEAQPSCGFDPQCPTCNHPTAGKSVPE